MVRRDTVTRALAAGILAVLLLIAFRGTAALGRREAAYPDVYAKIGWHRAVEVLPREDHRTHVVAMDLKAGKYVISAKVNLSSQANLNVECWLETRTASDRSFVILDGTQTTIGLNVGHVFLRSGQTRLICLNRGKEPVSVKAKIQAIRVGTLQKVQLPIQSPSPSPTSP